MTAIVLLVLAPWAVFGAALLVRAVLRQRRRRRLLAELDIGDDAMLADGLVGRVVGGQDGGWLQLRLSGGDIRGHGSVVVQVLPIAIVARWPRGARDAEARRQVRPQVAV